MMLRRMWKSLKAHFRGMFGGKQPLHPPEFAGYVEYAVNGVRGLGHEAPDERRSRWHLVEGRRITSFGEDDWVFRHESFRGGILGMAVWGNPIEVYLGSDGNGRYNGQTARHEAGHVTRMQAGDFGHNPVFRPLFQGWSDCGRRVPSPENLITADGLHFACVDYADGENGIVVFSDTQIAALNERSREVGYYA